jgi:hypothetical protein
MNTSKSNKKQFIMKNIKEKLQYLKDKGYDVAGIFLQGSQNYELDTYTKEYKSDIDCKAWIVPSLEDLIFGKKPVSTTLVLDNDEHIDLKDIRLVVDLLMGGNPSYVELINTDYCIYTNDIKYFVEHKDEISLMNKTALVNAIVGTFNNKKKAFKHVYPSRKEWHNKYGFDPKELHHMYRLLLFADAIFENGRTFKEALTPILPRRKELMSLKTGENIFETVKNLLSLYNISDIDIRLMSDEESVETLIAFWEEELTWIKKKHDNYVPNVDLKNRLTLIVNDILLRKTYQEAYEALAKGDKDE